jgi:hypothetical protein
MTIAGISIQLIANEYVAGVYEAHKDVKTLNKYIGWANDAVKQLNSGSLNCQCVY